MSAAQLKYLAAILSIALVLACSNFARADERMPLHVTANFVGTIALYQFLNLMGKAGCRSEDGSRCKNTKEMLVLAVPAMLATGLMMEATQSMERNQPIDKGDLGANLLGVGLAVGTVFVWDL